MLVEKLSANDIRLIDDYRKNYAFSSEANNTCGAFEDSRSILREWDLRKFEHLYKLFGEQFTISKHLNYSKSYEQLQDEIADFTQKRYGRVARSGEVFASAYYKLLYPNGYMFDHRFSDDEKNGLDRLMSDDCLITNKYDEKSFDLRLPDGHVLRVSSGCKVSKVLGKIANAFDLPGYEDFRICHSQILNQKNLGGQLTLSIHPLDYMTMSDNECDWESCMSWRNEGGYRMGTVEMMNSPAVIVAYLTAEDDMQMWPHYGSRNSETDKWNNKKWRQLFVMNEDLILSVKDYPYHNSELTEMVVRWIKELAEENLGWHYGDPFTYSFGETRIELPHLPEAKNNFRLEINSGAMYSDFGCLDFHWMCINPDLDEEVVVAPQYGGSPYMAVHYSGKSQCMVCGELNPDFEDESCLACCDCQDRPRCDCCGDLIGGDSHYIDGVCLCSYCYDTRTHECAACHEYHYDDYMTPVFVIPRIPSEMMKELEERYKEERPYDYSMTYTEKYDDFTYSQESTDIWVCDEDHLIDWAEQNLIEGATLHKRQLRWAINWYVYYDELTPQAQEEYCWGYDGDNEAYLRKFCYQIAYPSKFIELN